MLRSRRQTQRMYDIIAYAVLIAAFTFAIFPILWTLLTSLKSNADIVTSADPVRAAAANAGQLRHAVGAGRLSGDVHEQRHRDRC